MPQIKIEDKFIGGDSPCFIIAEIGQNHQGDIETAKILIREAKRIGADCVKFQKSCLPHKFTASALRRPYDSPHAWGKTYGDHKQFLEFTDDQYLELQDFAKQTGIIFTASAMDQIAFIKLIKMQVPFVKIGSGDANNFRLLRQAANACVPCVVSTGMQSERTVKKIVKIFEDRKFCLLHCVSAYPTPSECAGLRTIERFQAIFPNVIVGYSGHEIGILMSQAAVILGAKIIERHFTLDKTQKGSDHCVSLTPDEFEDLITKIRIIESELTQEEDRPLDSEDIINILKLYNDVNANDELEMRQALAEVEERQMLKCEKSCYDKLGKTLVYVKSLGAGEILGAEDICAKVSLHQGLPADLYDEIIGQILRCDVSEDDPVFRNHLSF